MFLDVVVEQTASDEWTAISREAAVVGEILVLDAVPADERAGETRQQVPVYVTDSQPVILEGEVRHRLRLRSADLGPMLFDHQLERDS